MLCSAACCLGSGRSRRPSSARIWSAIRHVGGVRLQNVNQAASSAVSPQTSLHVGFSRRAHSVSVTECARGESVCAGCGPGDRERARTAPTREDRPFLRYETCLYTVEM